MKVWPSSLPEYVQRAGYSESPAMPKASFAADAGPPLERPKGTMRMTTLSCSMRMTAQQLETFEQFVYRDLARGTLPVQMPHPRTREQVKARFTGDKPYRIAPTGGNTWIVSFDILVSAV